jgi:hypothetical protein
MPTATKKATHKPTAPDEPIFLVALTDGWAPRHPIHHPHTGAIVRFRNGPITKGEVFPALGNFRDRAEDYRCPNWCVFHDAARQAHALELQEAEVEEWRKATGGKNHYERPQRVGDPAAYEDLGFLGILPGQGPGVPGMAGMPGGWSGSPGDVGVVPTAAPTTPQISKRASDVDVTGG